MTPITKGRYTARAADGPDDLRAAQALRARAFGIASGLDADAFDASTLHVLIHDHASGTLVCCFRLSLLSGDRIADSYAAQYYELSALADFEGRMLELGRFCLHPDRKSVV